MTKRLLIIATGDDDASSSLVERSWPIAQALMPELSVTLALPETLDRPAQRGLTVLRYQPDGAALQAALAEHQLLLINVLVLHHHPFLAQADLPIIVDLSRAPLLNWLSVHAQRPVAERRPEFSELLRLWNELLRRGDFFICAAEAERSFYLGMLLANHRINPDTWAEDHDLRSLIDVITWPESAAGSSPSQAMLPLRRFCLQPRRAVDHTHYLTDAERVAADRGQVIESLLEFNYWYQSSEDRGQVIAGLEESLRDWQQRCLEVEQRLRECEARLPQALPDQQAPATQPAGSRPSGVLRGLASILQALMRNKR